MSFMALVRETVSALWDISSIFCQTVPWSDLYCPVLLREVATVRAFSDLRLGDMTVSESWKAVATLDQRLCSVQLTGMTVSDFSLTRIEVLRTRFCWAPASSSPSRRRTDISPLFMTLSSGTEPPELTSVTLSRAFSSASLRV